MNSTYTWDFPLPRTHTGMLQGNARLGVMIWGEGSVLRITLGRSDWWDHRGGLHWDARQSYANIRRALEANDESAVRELFEHTQADAGQPRRPSLLPVGRFELDFGPGCELRTGELRLSDGYATVQMDRDGTAHTIRLAMDLDASVVCVEWPTSLAPTVRPLPAWEFLGEELAKISFAPPTPVKGDSECGWVQSTPQDDSACALWQTQPGQACLTCQLGSDDASALSAARTALERCTGGVDGALDRSRPWWTAYWSDIPRVEIPNDDLRMLYEYGLYKFAGLTHPDGIAAGLQGPWIEEYRLPPWAGDYHFNINVQMCYWPAYRSNRLQHLRPLFELIASWAGTLQHNAKVFVGIDDGAMLPHAVDDRCTCMGGFWTGSIDHGCTAWMAEMMFRYYRYTLDEPFLRETAYPFMVAAMRVYEEMLERDGDAFVLPVSVSPEYRGSAMNAWGRNASFQLACAHRLCEDLLEASRVLGVAPKPLWGEILTRLPKACLIGEGPRRSIALWEGTPLEESHRHHSHMAAIVPFDTLDWEDPAWRETVRQTYAEWILRGHGLWSGWCIPWASMLHSRAGHAQMAEMLLEVSARFYCNIGRGTLHDADQPGFTLMGRSPLDDAPPRPEIMQMDLGMAAIVAVQEMLLHTKRGVHHLFRGCPRSWKRVGFERMRTDGAFLVSAERINGTVPSVRVESLSGGPFRLRTPWPPTPATAAPLPAVPAAGVPVSAIDATGREIPVTVTEGTIELTLQPGQTVDVKPRG